MSRNLKKVTVSKNDVPLAYNQQFKLGLDFLINRALCILV